MSTLSQTLSVDGGGMDLDLDEIWSQALEEYQRTTEISLKGNLRGFDTVADHINADLRQSKVTDQAKAQRVMGNVMNCLQRFGDIIAQATSVVFGPSQQCWNAVSFIISAAQGYQAVLDGFAALMERCAVFLNRLNIDLDARRQSGVPFDTRLRRGTYAVIAHFFTALGHSHKLAKSKRQKIKTVFKIVLFNDDDGVKDSLARMETLVKDLTDTKVSVILQDLQGLARYVRDSEEEINRSQAEIKAGLERVAVGLQRTETAVVQMHVDLNKRMTQEEGERNLRNISRALRVNAKELWQSLHGDYSNHRIAGTGTWLFQSKTTVPAWADVDRDGVKVILLIGQSGFGKSYLASRIVDHLLEKYPRGTSGAEPACVAYYYFQNTPDESLAKCLGSIVFQLAKTDRAYANAVAAIISKAEGLADPQELWRRLVVELRHLIQGTCFIVLDGLKAHEDDEKFQSALSLLIETAYAADDVGQFRLFITMQEADLTIPAFSRPGIAIPRIRLGPSKTRSRRTLVRTQSQFGESSSASGVAESLWNEEDVVIFTNAKLAAMCERKPYLSATLRDPSLNAAATLARGVKGNYSDLQLKFDQIAASDNAKDIVTVVNDAAQDPLELLHKDVNALNESLTSDDIQELNELLLWVTGLSQPCTLKLLQAALGDKTIWLEKHIPQKFYHLLRWDESSSIVEMPRSAEIMSVLQTSDVGAEDDTGRHHSSQEGGRALQENEIQLVQRVVKTFCGDQLFDKFGFQAFFESKAVKRNVRIEIPATCTMHTRILRRCLQVLCQDQDDPYFEPLRSYAMAHLMDHLDYIDLNVADRRDLKAIGSMLFDMISVDRIINVWWSVENASSIMHHWIVDVKNVNGLAKCLRHPLVATGYQEVEQKSKKLKGILAGATDGLPILQCVAECLARRWFCKARENGLFLWWPYSIFAEISGLPPVEYRYPTISALQQYFDWVRQLPDLEVSPSRWNVRMAATLLTCEHDHAALEKCLEVEITDKTDWPVVLKTAEIYTGLGNHKQALECLHRVREHEVELMATDLEFADIYWATIRMREGLIHQKLRDYDAAETCFRAVFQSAPVTDEPLAYHLNARLKAVSALFDLWEECKTYQPAMDLFKQWSLASEPAEGAASWFLRLATSPAFHKCLLSAVVNSSMEHTEALHWYESALDMADPLKQSHGLKWLEVWHATLLYHTGAVAQRPKAFDSWQSVVEASSDDSSIWSLAYDTLNTLSKHLLDDAILHGMTSPRADEHYKRLEELSQVRSTVIDESRRTNNDPCLALARFHALAGRPEAARATVLDRLRAILDQWPDPTDTAALTLRYPRLGQTFAVLGDDENAVAAWSLMQPDRPAQPHGQRERKDDQFDSGGSDVVAGAQQFAAEDDLRSQVPAREEITLVGNEIATDEEIDNLRDASEPSSALDDLESQVMGKCDGCERQWKALGDCYTCRDCFDRLFCAPCHSKLRAGKFHVTLCNPDHDHLYIPPFDRRRWEELDPATMVVGDRVMARSEWLDGLREQWGLQQVRIDQHKLQMRAQVQAAKAITRWRRALLRARAATK